MRKLALIAAVGAALAVATAASASDIVVGAIAFAAAPAAASSANGYPDWAAAIVPAYSSRVTSKGRTTDQFYDVYQINTADPYETVLAWYKAHVPTTWPDRHPDQTVGKVGKVHITLQKAQASDGTRTSIGFTTQR